MNIEPLEQRIAPASVFGYTDVDGDLVKITASKGDLKLDAAANIVGGQLRTLDLTDLAFQGANITFTVTKVAGGDGFAHVGHINAAGRDLGTITVHGDLGKINAGDVKFSTPAIKKLSALSMGAYGLTTQGGGDLISKIFGSLGALTVAGDVKDVLVDVFSNLGSVTIGGSLIGGAGTNTGVISSINMGALKIGGDVIGGAGFASGIVSCGGKLASVTVGGSLLGGSGSESGRINANGHVGSVKISDHVIGGNGNNSGGIFVGSLASVTVGGSLIGAFGESSGAIDTRGSMGAVKIAGNVEGGVGSDSGAIHSDGNLASVTIGDSLIGGTRSGSGGISADGRIGPVKIGGDLQGGSVLGQLSVDRTGYIEGARIASVTIGGSVRAGIDNSFGTLTRSGAILAADDLGPIVVKGSIAGNVAALGTTLVTISVRGHAGATGTADLALASLTVGGDVHYAKIQAGLTPDGLGQNADAQIGAVKVGGDWMASQLLAGVEAGEDGKFGTYDDEKLAGNYGAGPVKDGKAISRIASIVIGGRILGTAAGGDHFGFVAEQIGRLSGEGVIEKFKPGPGNDFATGIYGTTDVGLIEVPVPF